MASRAISTPGAARAQAIHVNFGVAAIPALTRPLVRAERERVERLIEQLLALLDTDDGDFDLEPDPDLEPSIGYSSGNIDAFGYGCTPVLDGELDECDLEPALGWTDEETATEIYAHGVAEDV